MTKDSKYDNNLSENGQLQLNQYFRRRSSFQEKRKPSLEKDLVLQNNGCDDLESVRIKIK